MRAPAPAPTQTHTLVHRQAGIMDTCRCMYNVFSYPPRRACTLGCVRKRDLDKWECASYFEETLAVLKSLLVRNMQMSFIDETIRRSRCGFTSYTSKKLKIKKEKIPVCCFDQTAWLLISRACATNAVRPFLHSFWC